MRGARGGAGCVLRLAVVILLFLAGFLYLVFRAPAEQGSFLNACKAPCYGVGPCVRLG